MWQNRSMRGFLSILLTALLLLAGCTKDLIHDDVKQTQTGSHCSGSERVDDSTLAVLPVPFVAFFTPRVDLHDIKADDYLRRCGEPSKLINRHVKVNRIGCIPAGLSYIITLGVFQWCPANVSWEADVKTS